MGKTVTLDDLLQEHIRPVTEEDRKKKLPTYSYSKLDLFEQCNYRYLCKYIQGNYDSSEAIHLSLGTLAHKLCELKGRAKIEGKDVDYDYLSDVLLQGIEEKTDKGSEMIVGLNDIKKQYFESFYEADNASGMNYQQKLDIFMSDVLRNEMEDKDWNVYATELSFEFIYMYDSNGEKKEVLIHGFIDRVDQNENGDFRVVDYKTSKKKYDDKKMATPLQQCIYGFAMYAQTGKLPTDYQYDFIFINEYQQACTKGYAKRALKKLDKLFNQIDSLAESNEYVPNPSPLCHWCDYSDTNPSAVKYKGLCPYYSLWTPDNKTFKVNQDFTKEDTEKPKRKLVF